MRQRRWTARLEHTFCADLEDVLTLCFSRWTKAHKVRLLFTRRSAPKLISAVDKPSMTIGLFRLAIPLGKFGRQAALVHECCHLVANGMHGRAWKAAMTSAARSAALAGRVRLAKLIGADIDLYRRRRVTDAEVLKKLQYVIARGERTDYHWVLAVVADWAGWPSRLFLRRHPWLREAWFAAKGG